MTSPTPPTVEPGVPPSHAQSGIWFNERLGGIGTVYTMPFAIHFTGPLDVTALLEACESVIARHPVLTTRVVDVAGAPYLAAGEAPIVTHHDLCDLPPERARARREAAVRAAIDTPFDLTGGPLIRTTLFTEDDTHHQLLVCAHHLGFDGTSTSIFVRDLARYYGAAVLGSSPDLPRLPTSVEVPVEDPVGTEAARRYWREHAVEPVEVVLPGLNRTTSVAGVGEAVAFTLDNDTRAALVGVAKDLGATVFEIMVATWGALPARYGTDEPTIAVDLGTRTSRTRDSIGAFVNELPFHPLWDPTATWRELVERTRARLRELYPVRAVPISRAVGGVRPAVALAPISLGYRERAATPTFPGVTAEVDWALFNHTARGALRVHIVDGPEEFGVTLQYSPEALTHAAVRRVAEHWRALLAVVTSTPDAPVGDVALLGSDERERLLGEWNATEVDRPPMTVTGAFEARVARTPNTFALRGGDTPMTYAELDAAAERLAVRLRAAKVGPGVVVAVALPRSAELVIALLAIGKACGAYLPLDVGHPVERLAEVTADAGARVLLIRTATAARMPRIPAAMIAVDAHASEAPVGEHASTDVATPAHLAYVIYTSGSTGRPKGVEIEHRALMNLLAAMRDELAVTAEHVWLLATSPSFDIAALEVYLPLIVGAGLVLADETRAKDGTELLRLIREHGVTHVQATPSGWRMLLATGFDESTVTAVSGGEALSPALARELMPRVKRLVNAYGPTETTVWSTLGEISDPVEPVTVGRPLANTTIRVLDERLRLTPIGVPGELYIGGAGLARGYHAAPGPTALRFVPDPYGPSGSRLYRTGDRARYHDDGRIELIGRVDDQVKVRGHRVEPAEIEARLAEHPHVAAAAVAVRGEPGDERTVGYVVSVPDRAPPEPADLRAHLVRTLPDYMRPYAFVVVDALPLTPTGKVDRAALPSPPALARPAVETSVTAAWPAEQIREIWQDVLRVDDIELDDDLFDLGGHSLTMTQIGARIRRCFGVEIPIDAFFDDPTIGGVAGVVDRLMEAE